MLTPSSDTIQPRPLSYPTDDPESRVKEAVLDPKLFAQVFLNTDIWDTQGEILDSIANNPRTAVKACHASSKTFTAAIATLWFLTRYNDEAVVVTTAPTWAQVEKLLWGEIHSALIRSRISFPKPNQTELRIGPKRYAYGISTLVTKKDEGVRFQGIHAKNVLVIIDEAPGVDPKIWEAVEGARAGGNVRVLALGNPTISSGPFHTAFVDDRTGWRCFTIDGFDTPNLRGISLEKLLDPLFEPELDKNPLPYLITRRWVKEKYYEWGPGHPSWEARVRGQFPKQSADSLLSLDWLEEAALREIPEKETDEFTAGLDVAGPGEDETSLTIRRGPRIILHEQTTESDPRGWVLQRLAPYKEVLKDVNVDCIGIGWGMYQHIKDFKYPANPVNVCESANDKEKYADLKSEFYWGLRLRISQGDFCGLKDDKTIGQLAGIRWKANSRGQVEIESKEKARDRGVRSPDRAESIMLAFASRILIYGVLDYLKRVSSEKQFYPSQLINKEEVKPNCPKCNAICVVPNNTGFRCNQCGYQFGQKKVTPVIITRDQILKMKRW